MKNWELQQILKQVGLEKLFLKPEVLLAKLKKELKSKIKIVNRAILKGDNKDVKVEKKSNGSQKWKLIYNAKEEETNHLIYNQFPVIGIVPLLNWEKPSKYPDKYLIKPCRKLNEQAQTS